MRESYKKSVLHFFCAIQTSDGGMEKKRRMEREVESGGFVGNVRKSRILRKSRNGGKPPLPDITERAARSPGRAGYSGPCGVGAGIQSMARKFCADRKRLIYKYICRKMIYFAIKTA